MGFLDKFRKASAPVDDNPWATPAPVQPQQQKVNPWKPQRQAAPVVAAPENPWARVRAPVKVQVLRTAAKLMILVNVALGVFFYSNLWTLNAMLWGYLAIVTIILGHYLSVSG